MQRDKVVRSLRIAWSVAFGIFSVLLVALWVRSYWIADFVSFTSPTRTFDLWSRDETTNIYHLNHLAFGERIAFQEYGWDFRSEPSSPVVERFKTNLPSTFYVRFPIYLLVIPFAVIACVPWLPWTFSVRTLLIATTLVAVLLGTVACLRLW
jgi:hypothetical protein